MEKYKCRLCSRKFDNGRALGGHMKSHMMNLHAPSKKGEQKQPSEELLLVQKSCSSDEEENRKKEKKPVFTGEASSGVMLQNREIEPYTESDSESGSSEKEFRRSGMIRKSIFSDNEAQVKKTKYGEGEPVSSFSDITPEEGVAYGLMMLSRDKWDKDDEEEEKKKVEKMSKLRGTRSKYRCETCNKVFKSYQALGGHRASHKKVKTDNQKAKMAMDGGALVIMEERIHECLVCHRVFSSGQALGGHKRSHSALAASSSSNTNVIVDVPAEEPSSRIFDLNLPAPPGEDDNEIRQMDNNAISD